MSDVIAVIGSGSIGQAFARRVSVGKHILLADLRKIMQTRRPKFSSMPVTSLPMSPFDRKRSVGVGFMTFSFTIFKVEHE